MSGKHLGKRDAGANGKDGKFKNMKNKKMPKGKRPGKVARIKKRNSMKTKSRK